MNRITQKIVEVDRGKIYEYNGSYSTYLEQKAQREADAEAQERKNRTLYRQELEWIRRGVRARGTKSKDRIERFHALENRDKPQEMEKMQLQSVSSRLGKKTIELEHLSKSIDGKQLLRDFSYKLPRDARIGIVGHNGAGKSTLIKLICGELLPDSGNIVLGDTVRIGYFSQECEKMDPSQRVIDYIKETAERIQTPDGTVTAATMLERFLFTPELQWNRIEKLSGGERKRLYLLKVLMFRLRGFGNDYAKGFHEAWVALPKIQKPKFRWRNLPNYFWVEGSLIVGLFRYIVYLSLIHI